MKFWRAFNIFLFLLEAKEWYIIANNENRHLKDADIAFGKLINTINNDGNDFVNSETLLMEAKELINNK